MAQASVQSVKRGVGPSAALVDALERAPFDGLPLAVLKGQHADIDKLRTAFFSEKSKSTTLAVIGQSIEQTEEWPGSALYAATVDVSVSARTVGTEIDTLHRLHDWLSAAVGSNPNLDGLAVHARVVEADLVQRPGSRRVVLEASVEITYERGRL